MPLGLTHTAAVFRALIKDVLHDFLNHCVFVYLDDILIYFYNLEEHQLHVRQVLQWHFENKLFVKAEKCEFHVPSVTFRGYVFQSGQMKMDPDKVCVSADSQWLHLTSRKLLLRFLDFANFYQHCIQDYGKITTPLIQLTSP